MSDERDASECNAELAEVIQEALAFQWRDDDLFETEQGFESGLQIALRQFRSATTLDPDSPWVWFQVGWCSLALGLDREARHALERVIEIEPQNPAANLALAYAFYRSYDAEPSDDIASTEPLELGQEDIDEVAELITSPEFRASLLQQDEDSRREALWQGACGDHLRAALEADEPGRALYSSSTVADIQVDYFHTVSDVERFLDYLRELSSVVPEAKLGACYTSIGLGLVYTLACDPSEYEVWFRKAIRHEGSAEDMFYAYTYLATALYERLTDPSEACGLLHVAHGYLKQTETPAEHYGDWLMDVEELARTWDPGEEWQTLLDLCEKALDLQPFGGELPPDADTHDLASVAETAGRIYRDTGRLDEAEQYFQLATKTDPKRVTAARRLASLHISRQRWKDALYVLQHAVDLEPTDRGTRDLLCALQGAPESSAITESLALLQLVLDGQASGFAAVSAEHMLMRLDVESGFSALSAEHGQIRDELFLRGDLRQQVRDAQRSTGRELQRFADNMIRAESAYAGLVEELHNLVQDASLIQPAAQNAARHSLVAQLGAECFSQLLDASRHFLITPETVYHATQDIPHSIDSSLIAVEYAKVVETELKNRLMAHIGASLDAITYRGTIALYKRGALENMRGSWHKTLTRPQFTLGKVRGLLQGTFKHSYNKAVGDCATGLGLAREVMVRLTDDLDRIVDRYRNGAAHTDGLDRRTLDEFRKLLFDGGFLRRLAEVGRSLDAAAVVKPC